MSVISRDPTPDTSEDWAIWQCLTGGVLVFAALIVGIILAGLVASHPYAAPLGFEVVAGPSMSPTMSSDQPTIALWTHTDTVETGDIIIYHEEDALSKSNYIAHRVVDTTDDGRFITKGDGNSHIDQHSSSIEPVSKSQVRGEIIWWFDIPV